MNTINVSRFTRSITLPLACAIGVGGAACSRQFAPQTKPTTLVITFDDKPCDNCAEGGTVTVRGRFADGTEKDMSATITNGKVSFEGVGTNQYIQIGLEFCGKVRVGGDLPFPNQYLVKAQTVNTIGAIVTPSDMCLDGSFCTQDEQCQEGQVCREGECIDDGDSGSGSGTGDTNGNPCDLCTADQVCQNDTCVDKPQQIKPCHRPAGLTPDPNDNPDVPGAWLVVGTNYNDFKVDWFKDAGQWTSHNGTFTCPELPEWVNEVTIDDTNAPRHPVTDKLLCWANPQSPSKLECDEAAMATLPDTEYGYLLVRSPSFTNDLFIDMEAWNVPVD